MLSSRRAKPHINPLPVAFNFRNDSGSVDMSLNKVATQASIRLKRSFQIDPMAFLQLTKASLRKSFFAGFEVQSFVCDCNDCQTAAVQRDAVAHVE